MITEEELEKIKQEAEEKARAIAAAILDPGLKKLDADMERLDADRRELKKIVNLIMITSGHHPRMRIAASNGRRIDPVEDLNNGLMINRFNERN